MNEQLQHVLALWRQGEKPTRYGGGKYLAPHCYPEIVPDRDCDGLWVGRIVGDSHPGIRKGVEFFKPVGKLYLKCVYTRPGVNPIVTHDLSSEGKNNIAYDVTSVANGYSAGPRVFRQFVARSVAAHEFKREDESNEKSPVAIQMHWQAPSSREPLLCESALLPEGFSATVSLGFCRYYWRPDLGVRHLGYVLWEHTARSWHEDCPDVRAMVCSWDNFIKVKTPVGYVASDNRESIFWAKIHAALRDVTQIKNLQ